MKKLLALFSTLLLIAFMAACSSDPETTTATTTTKPEGNFTNPNGTSELARLMREMQAHAEQMRAQVVDPNAAATTIPSSVANLTNATPTDPTVKGETFNAYAANYQNALKLFYGSEQPDTGRFNFVVQTCLTCHQSFCPGPMGAINKLTIK